MIGGFIAAILWLPPLWTILCVALVSPLPKSRPIARLDLGALSALLAFRNVRLLNGDDQSVWVVGASSLLSIVVYGRHVHPMLTPRQRWLVPGLYVGTVTYLFTHYGLALATWLGHGVGGSLL